MVDSLELFERNGRFGVRNLLVLSFSSIREILCYPLHTSSTLIKLGYIPKELFIEKTELEHQIFEIPSKLSIVWKIFTKEGINGLSRGFFSRIASILIYENVLTILPDYVDLCHDKFNNVGLHWYLQNIMKLCIVNTVGIILSHPFEALSTIQVGQYIGKESVYSNNACTAFAQLYIKKGISGCFGGIIPRIIRTLFSQVAAYSSAVIVNWCLGEQEILYISSSQEINELHSYLIKYRKLCVSFSSLLAMVVAGNIFSHLEVLEKCYAVLDTEIVAGREPFTFVNNTYQTWTLNFLTNNYPQLDRKANLISKLYITNPNLFVPYD